MKNKRYNMRKAAKILGVTRQTIYYWFKKGWVTPKRDYPVFTEEDIKRINKWSETLQEKLKDENNPPTIHRLFLRIHRFMFIITRQLIR